MHMKSLLFLLTAATVAATNISKAKGAVLAEPNSKENSSNIALPELHERLSEAGQDSPPSSDEEPELKKLSPVRDMERGPERMPKNEKDIMRIDVDAPLKSAEGPEVLCMDMEALISLGRDMMIKLTKDLTANEWNKLLENFWVEDEDNTRLLFYTLNYDDDKRLEMLEEALNSNFKFLFAAMSDPAHVPRTPRVTRLLEQGIEAYPEMRRMILYTIYQLGYPTTKWHLGNSSEDFDLLRNLMMMGWNKRAALADHAAEIVTLYSPKIWIFLLANNRVIMQDMLTREFYCKVCGLGGKEYLQWVKDNFKLVLDQECINAAVSGGHENVIEFIAEECGRMKLLPSQRGVNEAAANGMLVLLIKKCPEWGQFPNILGANGAARNGHLEVLKWLATLEPEERRVYPDHDGANQAARNGHIKVLKWLAKLEPEHHRVYPDQDGANDAAWGGHIKVLKWLAERRVYPNRKGALWAAENGNLKVLKWLTRLEPEEHRVYPDPEAANEAAANGNLSVLKWLATLEPKERRVYPDQKGANIAAECEELDVLEWLARLEPEERRVYPDRDCVNQVVENGDLGVLQWLYKHGVYPTQDNANWAAENGHVKVLQWLATLEPEERRVYPDQESANGAAWQGHLGVLRWLARERQVYPDQDGANSAARKGHLDVLKWLARKRQVYPSPLGANYALWYGHLDVLEWVRKQGLLTS